MRTRITKVLTVDKKTARIVTDVNPFHSEGGGQPGDSGDLVHDNFRADVVNCRQEGNDKVLFLKLKKGIPQEGMDVELDLNEARHHLLSRMHTGEHVLSRVMEKLNPGLHVYKVAIGEEYSSIFLTFDGALNWDILFKAEKEASEVVKRDLPVNISLVPIEEAKKMDGLKARWDRVTDETIRVVSIPDFDLIACSGSHVSSTGEIDTIFVDSYKGTKPEWEIRFYIGNSRERELSREMRILLGNLHCQPDEVGKIIDRLNAENSKGRKLLSRLQKYAVLPWDYDNYGDTTVNSLKISGISKEMVTGFAREIADREANSVTLALLDDPESERIPFILIIGKGLHLDLSAITSSQVLKAHGGGSNGFVSGVTCCKSLKLWIDTCLSSLQVL